MATGVETSNNSRYMNVFVDGIWLKDKTHTLQLRSFLSATGANAAMAVGQVRVNLTDSRVRNRFFT